MKKFLDAVNGSLKYVTMAVAILFALAEAGKAFGEEWNKRVNPKKDTE